MNISARAKEVFGTAQKTNARVGNGYLIYIWIINLTECVYILFYQQLDLLLRCIHNASTFLFPSNLLHLRRSSLRNFWW